MRFLDNRRALQPIDSTDRSGPVGYASDAGHKVYNGCAFQATVGCHRPSIPRQDGQDTRPGPTPPQCSQRLRFPDNRRAPQFVNRQDRQDTSVKCVAILIQLFGQPSDVARAVLKTVDLVSTQPSRVFAFEDLSYLRLNSENVPNLST